ncbi:hypothetical protein RUND412_006641 [Rhizina undulata]
MSSSNLQPSSDQPPTVESSKDQHSNDQSSNDQIPLEPDSNSDFAVDSNFGSDTDSGFPSYWENDSTASLISAARNHMFENGRRYHGYKEVSRGLDSKHCNRNLDQFIQQGRYVLPNDEAEQDRLDLMHHCCLLALHGELFIAPVGANWQPQKILDIGTGSGIWAIDIAETYPDSRVIGVDLSPIQPQWVPPNVIFEVDDIEDTWEYRDNSFDFIHIRHMAGFIYDWSRLYQQAFKALKPGGWIEVQDYSKLFSCDDGSLSEDNYLVEWESTWELAAESLGMKKYSGIAPTNAKSLLDAGCVQVGGKVVKLPIGRWPKGEHEKEVGMYWQQHMLDAAEGVTLALFTRVLGWDKEKVDKFLEGVYKDLKNPKYHVYSKFYVTYGRKPM